MKADSVVVVVQECRHVGLKLKGKNTVFAVHDLGVPGGSGCRSPRIRNLGTGCKSAHERNSPSVSQK